MNLIEFLFGPNFSKPDLEGLWRAATSHAGRVNLTKYVKLRGAASEKSRFCPVVHTSNGRIRPDYVLIDGRPEHRKEGAYYIEWYRDGRR